jgi:hypothetical protein
MVKTVAWPRFGGKVETAQAAGLPNERSGDMLWGRDTVPASYRRGVLDVHESREAGLGTMV